MLSFHGYFILMVGLILTSNPIFAPNTRKMATMHVLNGIIPDRMNRRLQKYQKISFALEASIL